MKRRKRKRQNTREGNYEHIFIQIYNTERNQFQHDSTFIRKKKHVNNSSHYSTPPFKLKRTELFCYQQQQKNTITEGESSSFIMEG